MRTLNALLGAAAMDAAIFPVRRRSAEDEIIGAATAELSLAAMDLADVRARCWPDAGFLTAAVHGLAHRSERRLYEARLAAEGVTNAGLQRLVAAIASEAAAATHANSSEEVALAIARSIPFRVSPSIDLTEAADAFGSTPEAASEIRVQTRIGNAAAVAVACIDNGEVDWSKVAACLTGRNQIEVYLSGLFAGLLTCEPLPRSLVTSVRRSYLIAGLAAGLDRLAADRCQLAEF